MGLISFHPPQKNEGESNGTLDPTSIPAGMSLVRNENSKQMSRVSWQNSFHGKKKTYLKWLTILRCADQNL